MTKFHYYKLSKTKRIRYLKHHQKNRDYIVFLHGFMSDLEGKKPKKFLNFAKKNKLGFYLVGDVGVGKTMILNFFFESLKEKKSRLHFNEFMVEFHDFIFENKKKGNDKGLEKFVKNLSDKTKILYFDEFQVTNIVDAMILGKLFERIFNENIKVIFSSNININDLTELEIFFKEEGIIASNRELYLPTFENS